MERTESAWRGLGARPGPDGTVEFRVWAPTAGSVAVRLASGEHVLQRGDEGLFTGEAPARPGEDYLYVLDGGQALPDPCSRDQPRGLGGPSRVLDTGPSPGPRLGGTGFLDELVVYELHVGAFSPGGRFDDVAARLPQLRELGVTAIEVMPVATFPGQRNWGYDGVYAYAPHPVYGGPHGFARLVDAAHGQGLGVILDVVYNHIGPGSEAVSAFGPYFTDRASTAWGEAIDYGRRGPREWAIQNAEMWIRDYRLDGLRLDATHAIFDDSEPHVLAELAQRVHDLDPRALVIAETEPGDLRPTALWGHDAQWADEFHHLLHVLLSGERQGYYADYPPSVAGLAVQVRRAPPASLVYCSQNHDQVGNRRHGDRPATEELAIRAATLLFAPQTPLLFMGEEYGERRPFQYFTDHSDPAIARAVREGRKRESLGSSLGPAGVAPDPQDPATFERSKLRPEAGDPELRALYARLLALRRELPPAVVAEVGTEPSLLHLRRGGVDLVLNFSGTECDGVAPGGFRLSIWPAPGLSGPRSERLSL